MNARQLTHRRKIIVSALALWVFAIWVYGELGTLALMVDLKTGEKYCINPFSHEWGISELAADYVFYSALLVIAGVPLALACWLFRFWKFSRN